MASRIRTDIAVIGAGIVGLSIGFRLAESGREIALIDPNEPGSGASYGNAGTLAPYACAPVGNPDVLRNLPALLWSAHSPLAIRWTALHTIAPWLLRFAQQSFAGPAHRNARALADLLAQAMPAWRALAHDAELSDMLRHEGCLYVFREIPRNMPDWAARLRTEFGVKQEWLDSSEVARLEPGLPYIAAGLFFPNAAHIEDPGELSSSLASRIAKAGTAFHRAAATCIELQSDERVRINCADDSFVDAHAVVIAAGAWSRSLARQCGDVIPLDTERGYHIEFPMDAPLITRPVSPIDLGFYMTPMKGRLRIAGTVELGGLSAPMNPKRVALLLQGARRMFPDLGEPTSQWLGFRPSLPDSLPVIGRSRKSGNVLYAFGHGHLGITLAPITSELILRAMTVRSDDALIGPFTAQRF